MRRFSRRRQQLLGQLNGTVEKMISGYRMVVVYDHQEATIRKFCDISNSLTKAGIRTNAFSGVMGWKKSFTPHGLHGRGVIFV